MSKYRDKVLKGVQPDSSDWAEFLQEAHRVAPGMTPKAFDAPRTVRGLNSYQILVEAAQSQIQFPLRALDLACGDGHLTKYIREAYVSAPEIVGVDMSEGELAVARSRYRDSKISFKCESADFISEPDRSFELVLCHMAFMLMNPIEPVVKEVTRVLKTNGIFAGIVNGGPAKSGFLLTYQKSFSEFMKKKFPESKLATMGDLRARSEAGIKELFSSPAYKTVKVSDFEILIKATPEGVWSFLEDLYNVSLLPSAAREEFKREIISNAEKELNQSGAEISFEFPMRLLTAVRA